MLLFIRTNERKAVNAQLTHAQDIVLELESSLDPSLWSGGPTLMALYRFLHNELITANVTKDAARIQICRGLVEPLATAWRQAASGLAEDLTSRAASAQQLHQSTQPLQAVTT